MIDFHSHILPNMDDGSRSISETMEMLRLSYSQGVDRILATSHFYIYEEDVNAFLSRRSEAYAKIESDAKNENTPSILLGAEVAFFTGMSQLESIERLCIGESKCILVEMPFSLWTAGTINEIYSLITRGLTPVIAHVERYPDFSDGWQKINSLVNMGALLQANAESIISLRTRKKILELLSSGVCVVGSDCHNMKNRSPNIGKAFSIARRRLDAWQLERVTELAEQLLGLGETDELVF